MLKVDLEKRLHDKMHFKNSLNIIIAINFVAFFKIGFDFNILTKFTIKY